MNLQNPPLASRSFPGSQAGPRQPCPGSPGRGKNAPLPPLLKPVPGARLLAGLGQCPSAATAQIVPSVKPAGTGGAGGKHPGSYWGEVDQGRAPPPPRYPHSLAFRRGRRVGADSQALPWPPAAWVSNRRQTQLAASWPHNPAFVQRRRTSGPWKQEQLQPRQVFFQLGPGGEGGS